MCEIADVRAGALHYFAIGGNEQVQFARQRRQILRECAVNLFAVAAPDCGNFVLQTP